MRRQLAPCHFHIIEVDFCFFPMHLQKN
uniref:Uncharacterized protein n=1 Tax=Arundo donax TaxID=35708 RepID=A0A0A9CC41_ARUDO